MGVRLSLSIPLTESHQLPFGSLCQATLKPCCAPPLTLGGLRVPPRTRLLLVWTNPLSRFCSAGLPGSVEKATNSTGSAPVVVGLTCQPASMNSLSAPNTATSDKDVIPGGSLATIGFHKLRKA